MPRSLSFCLAGLLLGAGSVAGFWWWHQQQLVSLAPPSVAPPVPLAQGEGLQPLLTPDPKAAKRCAERLGIRERDTPADPTNFGVRRPSDSLSGPVPDQPSLVVVHCLLYTSPSPRD